MASDKTEKPTPKRREDARRKGQVARRPELSAAIGFLSALFMMRLISGDLLAHAAQILTGILSRAGRDAVLSPLVVHGMMVDAVTRLALLTLPIIAAAMVAGIVGNFAQGGLIFTPSLLKPRGDRFNPIANLKRSLGINGALLFVKGLMALAAITVACSGELGRVIARAPALVGAQASSITMVVGELMYQLGLRAGAVLLLIAALDYGYGWYSHEKSMRMTKQEIRDEYRQQEGDPAIKNQRRRAARAMLQRHIATEVPRADVVVTNPTHYAVALRYDREKHPAPVVVAKGADEMARRIREIAKAHDVRIVENPPLARSLYRTVETGRVIPAELFRAVAELLAWVARQRGVAHF